MTDPIVQENALGSPVVNNPIPIISAETGTLKHKGMGKIQERLKNVLDKLKIGYP